MDSSCWRTQLRVCGSLLCGFWIFVTGVVAATRMPLKVFLGQLGGVESVPPTYLASIYPETAPTGQIYLKIYRDHHTPGQADPGGDEPDRPHDAEGTSGHTLRTEKFGVGEVFIGRIALYGYAIGRGLSIPRKI